MPTSIQLDSETEERLILLAERTGRSRAFYLKKAVEKALPQLEWEYDLMQRVSDVRSGSAETYTLSEVRSELELDD